MSNKVYTKSVCMLCVREILCSPQYRAYGTRTEVTGTVIDGINVLEGSMAHNYGKTNYTSKCILFRMGAPSCLCSVPLLRASLTSTLCSRPSSSSSYHIPYSN